MAGNAMEGYPNACRKVLSDFGNAHQSFHRCRNGYAPGWWAEGGEQSAVYSNQVAIGAASVGGLSVWTVLKETLLGFPILTTGRQARLQSMDQAMLAFKGPAQPSPTFCQLSGHVRPGQLALQHRDRRQEIPASGSQISGKDRVRGVGDIGDTRPLFLVLDVGVEKLNAPTQITD